MSKIGSIELTGFWDSTWRKEDQSWCRQGYPEDWEPYGSRRRKVQNGTNMAEEGSVIAQMTRWTALWRWPLWPCEERCACVVSTRRVYLVYNREVSHTPGWSWTRQGHGGPGLSLSVCLPSFSPWQDKKRYLWKRTWLGEKVEFVNWPAEIHSRMQRLCVPAASNDPLC